MAGFITDEETANRRIDKRNLRAHREALTNYAKELARQVAAEELKADLALDRFYEKAAALTSNKGDALLTAAGSALDLRRTLMDVNGKKRIVGNVLTAGSLGEDSLHHFAFSAFNTFDNALAPAHIVGNVANLYENLRDPNDWPDIVANTGGGALWAAGCSGESRIR